MIFKYLISMLLVVFFPIVVLAQEEEEEENFHMVDDEFVCLVCHTDIPKEGETSPTYFLVDDPSETCLGCHEETQHPGTKEHLGQKAEPMPADENGNIACFSCHDPHPQGVIKGRIVYDSELDERNRKFIKLIVAKSLEKKVEKEIAIEYTTDVHLRAPVNEICVSCHKPKKNYWRGYRLWDNLPGSFSY